MEDKKPVATTDLLPEIKEYMTFVRFNQDTTKEVLEFASNGEKLPQLNSFNLHKKGL